jgi:hypothetical protein
MSDAINKLNFGYDLDCGGYSFEEAPEGLRGLGCFVWDDPDPDSVPWVRDGVDYYAHSCPVYAFAPQDGHFRATEWPETYEEGEHVPVYDEDDNHIGFEREYVRKRIADGSLQTTDRDCHCHGKWVSDDDDPQKQKWEFTGNCMDKPFPQCDRCEGDGYVESQGGEWALYVLVEE